MPREYFVPTWVRFPVGGLVIAVWGFLYVMVTTMTEKMLPQVGETVHLLVISVVCAVLAFCNVMGLKWLWERA